MKLVTIRSKLKKRRIFAALFLPVFLSLGFTSNAGDTISVTAVGDVMLGTNFPPNPKYLPADCMSLLEYVKDYLTDSDITFANLEASIADTAELEKKCKDTTTCYAFRMPVRFAGCLEKNGFNLLSIANNHICDFGMQGQLSTMKTLDSLDIAYAGLKIYPWTIMKVDSLKIGFTAFSPNKGVNHINDTILLKKILADLRRDSCDIIIVSFHGGAEGSKYEHVPKREEEMYGESRGDVYRFAHLAIDNGADLVLGHGPHVTRAFEIYKDRFIAYSLGNFCTYERFNLTGPNGIAPIVKLNLDGDGKFISGRVIATRQLDPGIVVPDPTKKVIRRLNELIKFDFPESSLTLKEDGTITY